MKSIAQNNEPANGSCSQYIRYWENYNDIIKTVTVDQMRLPLSRCKAQAKPLFCTATTVSCFVPFTSIVSIIGASPKSASGLGPGGQLILGIDKLRHETNHTSNPPNGWYHLILPSSKSSAKIEAQHTHQGE